MVNKLYKVTLRGMHGGFCSTPHGIAYVVANNTDEAVSKVQKHLKESNIGTLKDRELKNVELIAEEKDYADCGFRLYL